MAGTEKLEERLKANPGSLVFARLADRKLKDGQVEEAISLCTAGLEKHPDYLAGRLLLGRCYLKQESVEQAIDAFVEVCRKDRRNAMAMKSLADLFVRQGSTEKAGDLYALLVQMDPFDESLPPLAAGHKGGGKNELFEILGISPLDSNTLPNATSTEEELKDESIVAEVEETLNAQANETSPEDAVTPDDEDTDLEDESGLKEEPVPPETETPVEEEKVAKDEESSEEKPEEAAEIPDDEEIETIAIPVEKHDEPDVIIAEEPAAPDDEPVEIISPPAESVEEPAEVDDGDIASRLARMFDDGTATEPPAEIIEPVPEEPEEKEAVLPQPSPEPGTLESRISGLFEPERTTETTTETTETTDTADTADTADDTDNEETEEETTEDEELTEELVADVQPDVTEELVVDAAENIDELLSGIEISDTGAEALLRQPEEHEETTREPMPLSGSDIADKIDDIFIGKPVTEEPVTEEPPQKVSSQPEPPREQEKTLEVPEKETPAVSQADTPPVSKPESSGMAGVTGDDVVRRLDGFFGKIPKEKSTRLPPPPPPKRVPARKPAEPVVITGEDVENRLEEFFPSPTPSQPPEKEDRVDDVPDHVLTPTLAHLYLQQGQPKLALSIYRRLLQKDPSNERLSSRIAEVEKIVAQGVETAAEQAIKMVKKPVPPRSPAAHDPRPLAGVRVRKKPDISWKRRSKGS